MTPLRMRPFLLASIILAAAAAGLAQAAAYAPGPKQQPAETLSGWVMPRNGADGGGFEVSIEGLPNAKATSAEGGQFEIHGVPPGEYVVTAARRDGLRGSTIAFVERGGYAWVQISCGSGTGTIDGRVLRGGRPAAGAHVRLVCGELQIYGESVDSARSGRFRFGGLEPGSYGLLATTDEGERSEPATAAVAAGATAAADLALQPGATISGRLVGEDGSPAPSIAISANLDDPSSDPLDSGGYATSADDGTFTVTGLRRGARYRLYASGGGIYLSGPGPVVEAPAEAVEIVLALGGRISCRLTFPRGAAASDVMLEAMDSGGGTYGLSGVAEEDGAHHSEGLPAGTYRIHAMAAGYAIATSGPVEVATGATAQVTVAMASGITLRGRVLTADGAPAAGARVYVADPARPGVRSNIYYVDQALDPEEDEPAWRDNVRSNWMDAARAGADGRFAVPHVGPGTRLVVATHPSAPPVVTTVDLPGTGAVSEVVLRFARGGTIAGRVVDPAGDAVPGASASLLRAGGPEGPDYRQIEVDADGRFRVDGLPAGLYVLGVTPPEEDGPAEGFISTVLRIRLAEGEERSVEVRLRLGTRVTGLVLRGGAPAGGARIELLHVSAMAGGPGGRVETGADGCFDIPGVRPGTYRAIVGFGSPGGWQAALPLVVPGGETMEVRLELAEGCIAGRVVDEGGAGVSGVMVLVAEHREGRRIQGIWDLIEAVAAVGPTDLDGTFTARGLAPGRYWVYAWKQGFGAAPGIEATAAGEPGTGLTITLPTGVEFRVVVRRPDGTPAPGASVVLVDAATGEMLFEGTGGSEADDSGTLTFRARPGRYRIYAYGAHGGEVRSEPTEIRGGETVEVAFGPSGAVDVLVRGPEGVVADAVVGFIRPDGVEIFRVFDPLGIAMGARLTDAAGTCAREGVPVGTYRVRATTADGRTAEGTVEVRAGETAAVEVVFP